MLPIFRLYQIGAVVYNCPTYLFDIFFLLYNTAGDPFGFRASPDAACRHVGEGAREPGMPGLVLVVFEILPGCWLDSDEVVPREREHHRIGQGNNNRDG